MTLHLQAKTEQGWIVDSPLQPLVFPDGAVHIKGGDNPAVYAYQVAYAKGLSHDELFTLAMWAEACRERMEKYVLILPYLPGARMDRGNPIGAQVYAWYINDIVSPNQLITIDPHSGVALQFFKEDYLTVAAGGVPHKTTVFPVERIIRHEIQDPEQNEPQVYQGVIAPDKGAHDRAAAAAKVMGNLPVYTAGKTRDFETGKLTGFHMEDELPAEGRFLIVDDICDGGGTFNGLAEAIGIGKDRLDLWVTHGIFSKGLRELRKNFGVIHTTDSYYHEDHNGMAGGFPADPDFVKVHKLAKYLYGEIDL